MVRSIVLETDCSKYKRVADDVSDVCNYFNPHKNVLFVAGVSRRHGKIYINYTQKPTICYISYCPTNSKIYRIDYVKTAAKENEVFRDEYECDVFYNGKNSVSLTFEIPDIRCDRHHFKRLDLRKLFTETPPEKTKDKVEEKSEAATDKKVEEKTPDN